MSVSDKHGLLEIAEVFRDNAIDIISTWWTANTLRDGWIEVQDVSDYTWQQEILGWRVKTLVPEIHGWLLADMSNPKHVAELQRENLWKIDVLVSNLYPFEDALESGLSFEEMIEKIDIGWPAMLRSSAKWFKDTTVMIDPNDYERFVDEIEKYWGTTLEFRKYLAAKAFHYTTYYDWLIAQYFSQQTWETFPHTSIPLKKTSSKRYWENPHQTAMQWTIWWVARGWIMTAKQIQWKQMSYNNDIDASTAYDIMSEFSGEDNPTCIILKHANPCGIATKDTIHEAYDIALESDSLSAFWWVVAVNREIDEELAKRLTDIFLEIIITPWVSEEAKEILKTKENLRVLIVEDFTWAREGEKKYKSITGGWMMVQDVDTASTTADNVELQTSHRPTPEQLQDLLFAFRVVKHVPSNGVVIVEDQTLLGPWAGQPSRVGALELAAQKIRDEEEKTGQKRENLVMASDAFFPHIDNIELAWKIGIKAIIAPGGSKADKQVIAKAEELWIALFFAETRHFKH